jgi:tetratricopeptide (TPR) repeat protein
MIEALGTTVKRQPGFARAHTRLAAAHLALFDLPEEDSISPLSLAHIRQAADASQFGSSTELHTWLSRAVGQRLEHLQAALQHAHRAAALGPLQGEAYLYLAELAFLEGPHSPGESGYVAQAAKVRPSDGDVLFEQGRQAMHHGKPDEAMRLWQMAFKAGAVYQKHLVHMLSDRLPAAVFLEVFEMDRKALTLLAAQYRQLERPEDVQIVMERMAKTAEEEARCLEGEAAAESWVHAANAYRDLKRPEQRIRCLRNAVQCDLFNYEMRHLLGTCLYKHKLFDEAEEHLSWCLQRSPSSEKLKSMVEATVDGRLRMSKRPSVGGL